MSCDPDAILDYLDDLLPPEERQLLERHLLECDACARLHRQQQIVDRVVVQEMVEDEIAPLTDDEMEGLLVGLPPQQASWKDRVAHFAPRVGLALAAAAAAAFLLVPRPVVDPSPHPVAIHEAPPQERVEMRLDTGDPKIQVVWVMDRNLQL